MVGQKLAAAGHGQDSLAIGLLVAAILTVPLVGPFAIAAGWQSTWVLLCCIAVGVLSTALPFPLRTSGATPSGSRYIFAVSLLNAGDK